MDSEQANIISCNGLEGVVQEVVCTVPKCAPLKYVYTLNSTLGSYISAKFENGPIYKVQMCNVIYVHTHVVPLWICVFWCVYYVVCLTVFVWYVYMSMCNVSANVSYYVSCVLPAHPHVHIACCTRRHCT